MKFFSGKKTQNLTSHAQLTFTRPFWKMMVMVYDIQLANHTCSNMIEKYIILVDGLKTL